MQDMKWTAEGILEAMDALIILENLSPLIDMTTLTTDHGDESYDRRRHEEEGRLPFGRNDRGQFY